MSGWAQAKMASGATIGSIFSSVMSGVDSNLVVLMGMVAYLTGITRTPFTSFVLVLEMTDRHSAIFPMMIAALAAYAMGKIIEKHSFYEIMKERYLDRAARETSPQPETPLADAALK